MNRNLKKIIKKINVRCISYYHRLKKCQKNKETCHYILQDIANDVEKHLDKDLHLYVRYEGLENIPTEPGFLMYSNHRGLYDALLILSKVHTPVSFVLKEELEQNKILNLVKETTGSKSIARNPREDMKVILEIIEEINTQKKTFCIFPEGTRNTKKELLPFKAGAFKIALKTKAPILPIVVANTEAAFDKETDYMSIHIKYLTPIPYEEYKDLNTQQLSKLIQDRIQKEYEHLAENLWFNPIVLMKNAKKIHKTMYSTQ